MSSKKVANLIKLMSVDSENNNICDYNGRIHNSSRNLSCAEISCSNCLLYMRSSQEDQQVAKQEVIRILNEY